MQTWRNTPGGKKVRGYLEVCIFVAIGMAAAVMATGCVIGLVLMAAPVWVRARYLIRQRRAR